MNKGKISLIIFAVLAVLTVFISTASAQEIDVDSMDNEQLMNLVLQILQKLEQSEEDAEIPDPISTPTPVPTEIPEPELSDDRAELEALLTAIMQKLQLEEPDVVSEKYAGVSVSAGEPEVKAENSIWENKKLIIEALPGYMFIQPTRPVQSESETGPQPDNRTEPTPVPGTVCDPNFPDFCFWWPVDGEVVCVCGELG